MIIIESREKNVSRISNFVNSLGLYTLFFLLIINPFHFYFFDKIVYYREIAAVIFSLLCCMQFIFYGRKIFDGGLKVELILVLLFPLVLMLFAMVDPGKNLYGIAITETSLQLKTISPIIYVIRNSLLYLPMVIYFLLKGLTENDLRRIALLIVIIAPFSIFDFVYYHDLATFRTFWVLSTFGGAGLQYNTYVPYLTFVALSALYLINTKFSTVMIKLISFSVFVFVVMYIILATSRQSSLFVLFCSIIFYIKSNETTLKMKLMLITASILCILILIHVIVQGIIWDFTYDASFSIFSNNPTLEINRTNSFKLDFSSVDKLPAIKTPRLQIMKYGLSLLAPHEYFTGAGLTSVITSGPHNDYIRWLQRIGIVGMLIGFYPFFRALFLSSRLENFLARENKNNNSVLYLFLGIMFTMYHSLFGYPREDAYQALYCFLGLSCWLGYRKNYFMVSLTAPLKEPVFSRFIYVR